jgi:hypothetical protein
MKHISIGKAFSFAFQTLKKYHMLLLGPIIFLSFLTNMFRFFTGENPSKIDFIFDSKFIHQIPNVSTPIPFNVIIGITLLVTIILVTIVVSISLTIGRFRIAFHAFDKNEDELNWKVYNNFGKDIIGRYFLTILFSFLIILVGYIFLIIPGIILQLMFQFTLYVLVEKQVSIKNAFKISYKLTNGIKGTLFGYCLLIGFLELSIFLLIFILQELKLYYYFLPLNIIVVPVVNMFFMSVMIGIYKDLSDQQTNLDTLIAYKEEPIPLLPLEMVMQQSESNFDR